MRTCITYHEKFSKYDLGVNHPFRGDRFTKTKEFFERKGVFRSSNIHVIKPKAAKRDDILKVHTRNYVDQIQDFADRGTPYDFDTPLSKEILEALMYMIGGVLDAATMVFNGEVERAIALGGGFHHAGRNYGGGFCIFNDIAILVEHLREKRGLKRFLILDYDVHAGNGTSDIYYSDPTVLFISLHQDPRTIFPGKGFVNEIGQGEGEGYNINVPLPIRTGEESYLYIFKEIFPLLAREFKPEVVIANGGSDAHFADHLGSLGLTAKGFFEIAKTVGEVSKDVCNDKAMLLVTSGYNTLVLPYCWYALTAGLSNLCNDKGEINDYYPPPSDPWQNKKQVQVILEDLTRILGRYWKCF